MSEENNRNEINLFKLKLDKVLGWVSDLFFYLYIILSFFIWFYVIVWVLILKIVSETSFKLFLEKLFLLTDENNSSFFSFSSNINNNLELREEDYLTEEDIENSNEDDDDEVDLAKLDDILKYLDNQEKEEVVDDEGEPNFYSLYRYIYWGFTFAILWYIVFLFWYLNQTNNAFLWWIFIIKLLIIIWLFSSLFYLNKFFKLILTVDNKFLFFPPDFSLKNTIKSKFSRWRNSYDEDEEDEDMDFRRRRRYDEEDD